MTERDADDILAELVFHFGQDEARAAVGFSVVRAMIDASTRARARAVELFAGQLSAAEVARAADAAVAIVAAGLTEGQLAAGRRLAARSLTRDSGKTA